MLTVIIKGTNACNMRCRYCSLGDKSNFKFITEDKLIDIFKYIYKFAKYNEFKSANIIFHGGEPLLIDTNIYSSAIDFAMSNFKDINFRWCIQTNAFKLNEKIIQFLKKYNVNVGVSIDGGKDSHNKVRVCENGYKTYDRVWNNIVTLKENRIPCSAIMVLSSISLENSLDYLYKYADYNIPLKINPLINCGDVLNNSYLELQKYDYANYLIKVYKFILENNIDLNISPINKMMRAIINNECVKECTFSKDCSKKFISIDYNGDIYPCGRFSDQDLYKLGNIEDDIYAFRNKEYISLIKRKSIALPTNCKVCKYKKYCNGGCSAEAIISSGKSSESSLCEDYKRIFGFLESEGINLIIEKLEKEKNLLESQIK